MYKRKLIITTRKATTSSILLNVKPCNSLLKNEVL